MVLQIQRRKLYIRRMSTNPESSTKWQDAFFRNLARPRTLLDLFDHLPGVYMYIKDADSRFVRANRVVCDVIGVSDPDTVVGKTDFDFFPPAIAAQYVAEDQRVISTGQPLSEQVWLVPGKNGVPQWYLCSKIPLLNRRDQVVGIAGVKRPYEYSEENSAGYGRLMSVVAFVTDNYSGAIEVSDMAEHVHLSVSQLQREFSRHFGTTPNRYLREVRIGVARHLLESSDASISKISGRCGFYDQSHFNRHFKASTGLTPLKYRQRYRSS